MSTNPDHSIQQSDTDTYYHSIQHSYTDTFHHSIQHSANETVPLKKGQSPSRMGSQHSQRVVTNIKNLHENLKPYQTLS